MGAGNKNPPGCYCIVKHSEYQLLQPCVKIGKGKIAAKNNMKKTIWNFFTDIYTTESNTFRVSISSNRMV